MKKTAYFKQFIFNSDTISGGEPTLTWRVWFYFGLLGLGESKVEGIKLVHDFAKGNERIRDGWLQVKATEGTFVEMVVTTNKNNTFVRGSIQFILVDN